MTMETPHDRSVEPVGSSELPAERRSGTDRRRKRRYRFVDRRSGFRRRTAGAKMGVFARALYGLRERPARLARVLVAVNVLNLCDFLLTLLVLDSGGREANPILRPLLSLSPLAAGIFKLVVVASATLIVWRSRFYKLSVIVGLLMLAVFACLVVYDFVLVVLLRT